MEFFLSVSDTQDPSTMIEGVKRPADLAIVPAAVKRPRTELVVAAQQQQLSTTVLHLSFIHLQFAQKHLLLF